MNQKTSSPLNPITLLSAALLSVALTGCSTVKTHVNKSSVHASTFSFVPSGRAPSADEGVAQGHTMIQQALVNNLAAKGVRQVPSGGEVLVAYLVIVGNNSRTVALDSYFGYSDDSDALLSKVHSEQAINGNRRASFEAGTLVVDFVDPQTSKVLQRRTIQADVLRDLSTEQRGQRIQGIVDQALDDVPIAK